MSGPPLSVPDETAPAGRRWCRSPDHHEWLHMLLDRARKDLNDAYAVIARQAQPAGVLTLVREGKMSVNDARKALGLPAWPVPEFGEAREIP